MVILIMMPVVAGKSMVFEMPFKNRHFVTLTLPNCIILDRKCHGDGKLINFREHIQSTYSANCFRSSMACFELVSLPLTMCIGYMYIKRTQTCVSFIIHSKV